jgi:hypothetical protein
MQHTGQQGRAVQQQAEVLVQQQQVLALVLVLQQVEQVPLVQVGLFFTSAIGNSVDGGTAVIAGCS